MREGARTGRGLRVLLAGNFAPDEQQSMLRFEGMLARGLVERGHEVRSISPRPRFARLARPYRYGGWPKLLGYVDKLVLFPPVLARTVREFAPDVVHVVDQGNAGYGRAVAGVPVVGTCHDLLAARIALGELGRGGTGVAGGYWQRRILRSLARMNHVACVSEQTRRDLTRLAGMGPERTSVVPNGLNYPYRRCSEVEARAALAGLAERIGLPEAYLSAADGGFLFHVGGTQWYKNRRGVMEIYAGLRGLLAPMPRLVMAGKPFTAGEAACRDALGLGEELRHVGGVSEAELEALYSSAEGLLFPSLAEGFGWPIAEAQACGCAVFTTGRAPMTEVGGEAACYFAPEDTAEAARSIAAAWAGRRALGAAGEAGAGRWAPERMLGRYEELYRGLAAAKR